MLGWIGGKYYMADWLRQNSPPRDSFDTYAEVFGGAFWFYLENEEFFLDKKIYYNDYNVFITNFMASAACDEFCEFIKGKEKDDRDLFFAYRDEIVDLGKDREAVIARIPDFDLAWKYIYKMAHSHSGIWTANYFYKFGDTIDEETGEITRPAQNDKLQQIVNKVNDPYYRRMLKKVTRFSCLDFQDVINEVDSERTFFYCLSENTLVRTNDERLISIKDIKDGDLIFPNRLVKKSMHRHHIGDMVNIKIQGMPDLLSVTREHQVLSIPKRTSSHKQEYRKNEDLWSSRSLVKAENLQIGDYLLVPLGGLETNISWKWENVSKKHGLRRQDVNFNELCQEELFRFLGYYTAEGHIQRVNGNAAGVLLSFGAHEIDTWIKDCVSCIEKVFGMTPEVKLGEHPGVAQIKIWSSSIAEFIEKYISGKSANTKCLAADLLTAPTKLQKELLIGWLRGDGGMYYDVRNKSKLTGTTASKVLARNMFSIALRCGLRPSWKVRRNNIDVYFSSSEDISSLGWKTQAKTLKTTRRIINGHMLVRIKNVTIEKYDGYVYDLDVDGDDLFAAPYVLVHNCDPPYFNREHLYSFNEFSRADHERVANVIKAAKGRSLLSYYRYPELEEWFPKDRYTWDQKEFNSIVLTNSETYGTTKAKTNTEVIVGVNYNFQHTDLFDW